MNASTARRAWKRAADALLKCPPHASETVKEYLRNRERQAYRELSRIEAQQRADFKKRSK